METERMIQIKGRLFSESTIIAALKEHMNFEEEEKKPAKPFRLLDVTRIHDPKSCVDDGYRIIVRYDGKFHALDTNGYECATSVDGTFSGCDYEKITTFKAMLDHWRSTK